MQYERENKREIAAAVALCMLSQGITRDDLYLKKRICKTCKEHTSRCLCLDEKGFHVRFGKAKWDNR